MMTFIRSRSTLFAIGVSLLAALNMPLAQAEQTDVRALQFEETDIRLIINTVSELTGQVFVVDPRVKGKVTLVSKRDILSIPRDELYEIFLSILQVHGYATVSSGSITKILPEASAKQSGGRVSRRPPADELVTRVVEVKHVSSPQLVPILRPLVPQYGHLAAYAPANILIISDRAANVERLVSMIRRIDKAGDDEVEIIALENANATEVVNILNSLQSSGKSKDPNAPTLIADTRTNSILVGGKRATRLRIRAMITHLDTPIPGQGNTQVAYLKYANAKNLATLLQGFASKTAAAESKNQSNQDSVTILADEETNALIISAPPKVMANIRQVISLLDIRRAQILVEAIIAEVSGNVNNRLGFDLGSITQNGAIITNSLNALPGLAGSAISANGDINIAGFAGAVGTNPNANLTLGGALSRTSSAGVTTLPFLGLLQAISTDNNSNLLSTPSLITMDNQEAEINVGQEVPFLTGSFTNGNTNNTNNSVNPFQTIERRDVGIILRVTPNVVDTENLQLKIYQEVSDVVQGSASTTASDLITNKRTIDTTVLAKTGDIIALGGLIRDQVTENESKTPLLGDIPIVGGLFRSTNTSKMKQNLMVFIRPVILAEEANLARYSKSRYDYLRELQKTVAPPQRLVEGRGPIMRDFDNATNEPALNPIPTPAGRKMAPRRQTPNKRRTNANAFSNNAPNNTVAPSQQPQRPLPPANAIIDQPPASQKPAPKPVTRVQRGPRRVTTPPPTGEWIPLLPEDYPVEK